MGIRTGKCQGSLKQDSWKAPHEWRDARSLPGASPCARGGGTLHPSLLFHSHGLLIPPCRIPAPARRFQMKGASLTGEPGGENPACPQPCPASAGAAPPAAKGGEERGRLLGGLLPGAAAGASTKQPAHREVC